jgi:hypothetical protein
MSSDQKSQAERTMHIANWRVSGLTRRAYCEQHGINHHSLAHWIRHSNRAVVKSKKLTLVPAKISAKPEVVEANLLLQCPNGSKLLLPPGTSASWLGILLSHLS